MVTYNGNIVDKKGVRYSLIFVSLDTKNIFPNSADIENHLLNLLNTKSNLSRICHEYIHDQKNFEWMIMIYLDWEPGWLSFDYGWIEWGELH